MAEATAGLSGFFNVYKPAGARSTAVVTAIRRASGIRRVGHCGTLDPLAEGVLPIAVGRATRLSRYILEGHKRYWAAVLFGVATTTGDLEGPPVGDLRASPSRDDIEAMLPEFIGRIRQRPPATSAVRVNGQRAYHIARAGGTPAVPLRDVTIHRLDCVAADRIAASVHAGSLRLGEQAGPANALLVALDVQCSSGTYIRSLARDLGDRLECGATLFSLTRTAVGSFDQASAVEVWQIQAALAGGYTPHVLFPPDRAVEHLPACVVDAGVRADLVHGRDATAPAWLAGPQRIYDAAGEFIGIGDAAGGRWERWQVFTQTA